MPTYEYKCEKCGFVAEAILTIAERDDYEAVCPVCFGEMKRLIGAPVVKVY